MYMFLQNIIRLKPRNFKSFKFKLFSRKQGGTTDVKKLRK